MGEGIRGPVSEMEGNPALFWGDLWERGGTGQATGMGTGGLWGRGGLEGLPAPTSPALGPTGRGPWCS